MKTPRCKLTSIQTITGFPKIREGCWVAQQSRDQQLENRQKPFLHLGGVKTDRPISSTNYPGEKKTRVGFGFEVIKPTVPFVQMILRHHRFSSNGFLFHFTYDINEAKIGILFTVLLFPALLAQSPLETKCPTFHYTLMVSLLPRVQSSKTLVSFLILNSLL